MIYSPVSEMEIISELYISIMLYNIKLVLGGWTILYIIIVIYILWYMKKYITCV